MVYSPLQGPVYFFWSRDCPDISLGISRPIRSKTVGATSAILGSWDNWRYLRSPGLCMANGTMRVCVYVCVLTQISTIAISQMSWEFGTNRMKVERLLVLCFEDEVKVSSWQCESMDRNDKNYWHKQNNKTAPSNRERVFYRWNIFNTQAKVLAIYVEMAKKVCTPHTWKSDSFIPLPNSNPTQ